MRIFKFGAFLALLVFLGGGQLYGQDDSLPENQCNDFLFSEAKLELQDESVLEFQDELIKGESETPFVISGAIAAPVLMDDLPEEPAPSASASDSISETSAEEQIDIDPFELDESSNENQPAKPLHHNLDFRILNDVSWRVGCLDGYESFCGDVLSRHCPYPPMPTFSIPTTEIDAVKLTDSNVSYWDEVENANYNVAPFTEEAGDEKLVQRKVFTATDYERYNFDGDYITGCFGYNSMFEFNNDISAEPEVESAEPVLNFEELLKVDDLVLSHIQKLGSSELMNDPSRWVENLGFEIEIALCGSELLPIWYEVLWRVENAVKAEADEKKVEKINQIQKSGVLDIAAILKSFNSQFETISRSILDLSKAVYVIPHNWTDFRVSHKLF